MDKQALAGFLIVDKPAGVTSFSMVALVRRLTGVRRVGHAGTLDPLATGVLPVAVGRATRLIEYLDDAPKRYLAGVRLGVATDTYDAEGAVTSEADASAVTAEQLGEVLGEFVGEIDQRPPAYSALKLAGRPLYKYAREGTAVDIAPRRVRIDAIELRSFSGGIAEIDVRCGKGTYIRSLAHDVGQRLGCGAHLVSLRRTASGGFGIEDAHSVDKLNAAGDAGKLEELLLAPDRAVERRPAAIVGAPARDAIAIGRAITLAASPGTALARAYSTEGEFLAMLRRLPEGGWHPEKVLLAG
jgi:tRNA pseudouridine55 synthase